ncbi:hypothetical protein GCM10010885_16170 [Alicyclobacillus cellulosilyticus]|uniref:HTH cro/C1-type domain-containing protein n=1 Tax=Alicyclobacillus cellulosilyticus TaxID=1003997 RepID=A0A917NKP0_9BACL|nr:helix-turn-helix transcriptional regulator [Alicyclobacillus cellulosilyticus]GGJ07803.1 hypothetical protein GCM10010885_16170 [Alicyclobacillus cellulosilyticus]
MRRSEVSGHPSLPWLRLAAWRKRRGLSQRALAEGIVTQTMLSHIERGRVFPSEATLVQLARRLELPEEELLAEWRAWRGRERMRARLWQAAVRRDAAALQAELAVAATVVSPFEIAVYAAWAAAIAGSWREADRRLTDAWLQHGMPDLPALARRRVLAASAWVNASVAASCGRGLAAQYWRDRARRFADTRVAAQISEGAHQKDF